MTSVLVAGETLIDFLPATAGKLATVESFHRRPGGAPANVAVGLARLDVMPRFWTRVGDDPFGDFLVTTLREAGLSDTYVERDSTANTGLAFVSLGADAEREFSFHRNGSADTRLDPDRIDESMLAGISWVHIGGVTLADEPARTATLDLAKKAQAAGMTVSFDPNARPELWTDFDFADSVETILSRTDVAKVTAEDLNAAGYNTDQSPETLAQTVCASGPHTTLLTLGSDGALAYATPEAPWNDTDEPCVSRHEGYSVDPVDTTGAGDAFTAGAIATLSAEESLSTAVATANAVAALTTTEPGAMTALPTREALATFQSDAE